MELIPGQSVDKLWPSLNQEAKTIILSKLRKTFDQMRSLQPPSYFGSVVGGGLPHALFWTVKGEPHRNGPFATGRDLILSAAEISRTNWNLNERHSYKADFFERHISHALDHHAPTFSLSDLLLKNIVAQEIHCKDLGTTDFEVGIVDWELAGWYPAYWEYAVAFADFNWNNDEWPNTIEKIIDSWCAESAMLKLVIDDILK